MEFISGLALVLLTMVGYSSGAVLAGKNKHVVPGLVDLVVLVVLWVAAIMTRPFFGKWWSLLAWLVIGLVVSAVYTSTKVDGFEKRQGIKPAGNVWEAWKAFAAKMGDYQSRMLLLVFYFVVVTPFGLAVSLFSDPLDVKSPSQGSLWVQRETPEVDLDKMRKQS